MSDSSTGQIVGGIIGAVVGYFTAGISVAFGFAAGSAIGGAIAAEDETITGPRRDDLKVQTSAYGRPLPFVYGTVPIAGNVVWLENDRLQEVKNSEDVGGKGGGGTTQETFAYFATFAVTLCEGPIHGVRRIWADADLIYDRSTDVNARTLFGSDRVMVSGDDLGDGARILLYRGTQDQTPNSRIEADKGDAPAYRGTAYLVLEDFPLEKYGNRIPSITAEVVRPSASESRPTLVDIASPAWPGVKDNQLDTAEDFGRVIGDTLAVNVNPDDPRTGSDDNTDNVDYVYSVDGDLIEQRRKGHRTPASTTSDAYAGEWGTGPLDASISPLAIPTRLVFQNDNGRGDVDVYVIDTSDDTDGLRRVHRWENDGGSGFRLVAVISPNREHLFLVREDMSADSADSITWERYDASTGFDAPIESGAFVATSAGDPPSVIRPNGGTAPLAVEDNLNRMWSVEQNYRTLLERDANGDFAVVNVVPEPEGVGFHNSTVMAQDGLFWVFYEDSLEIWYAYPLTDRQSEPLQDIVEDLTTRTGIPASAVDASALSGDVRGYTFSRVSSARQALMQLRKVFPFDIRESGYKVEFVPRGQSSVATLTDEDLGAHERGQELPAIVGTERAFENEQPQRIHLTYKDAAYDYE
ncbi:MAG: phage tail protein, partial [Halofilum sp. (in: g-proteobacteria)]